MSIYARPSVSENISCSSVLWTRCSWYRPVLSTEGSRLRSTNASAMHVLKSGLTTGAGGAGHVARRWCGRCQPGRGWQRKMLLL